MLKPQNAFLWIWVSLTVKKSIQSGEEAARGPGAELEGHSQLPTLPSAPRTPGSGIIFASLTSIHNQVTACPRLSLSGDAQSDRSTAALHKWLCFPLPTAVRNFPLLPVHSLRLLTKGFWGFCPFFARPTFLHRGDPPGWQNGHCDPSRLKAALLRSDLLLSTATTLQLMSCKSQRDCPKSCSKQHLTQAWREPQLREDRL